MFKKTTNAKGIVYTVPASAFSKALKESNDVDVTTKQVVEFEKFKVNYLASVLDAAQQDLAEDINDSKEQAGEIRVKFYAGSSATIRVSDGVHGHMSPKKGEPDNSRVRLTIKSSMKSAGAYVEAASRFKKNCNEVRNKN